jgi:hypothetical protein
VLDVSHRGSCLSTADGRLSAALEQVYNVKILPITLLILQESE